MERSQYKSSNEWKNNNRGAYNAAKRYGLLEKICIHFGWNLPIKRKQVIKQVENWTLYLCKKDALKYNTKQEWSKNKNGTSAYQIALRNNWIDECCGHMITNKKPNNYWTVEKLKNDALKHTTKSSWQKAKKSGYWTAQKKDLIDECCLHMK